MLVFDATMGKRRRPVEALVFHPDGRRIVAGGGDNTWTTFHDAATGSLFTYWPANPQRIPHNVVFHPEGRWMFVACGTHGLYALDVPSGYIHVDKQTVYGVAVSPGGERLLADGADDRIASLRVDSKKPPVPEWEIRVDGGEGWRSQRQAFFPDGERFVSAEYLNRPTGPDDARLVVRSAADGSLVGSLGTARGTPWQVEVSPDGDRVALRVGAVLLMFSAAGGDPVEVKGPNKKHPTAIAFHPGGRYLAVTCNDRTVRFHDRDADWAITRTYEWDAGRLRSVAFSPDGALAAAGGDTGKVVVWDVDA